MIDFLTPWVSWLVGGSLLMVVAVAALAYAVGAQKAVELVTDALKPVFVALGGILANALTVTYETCRDGAIYIARSPKAVFTCLIMACLVAGFVYVPTAKKAEKRGAEKQIKELRKNYRFVPKKKEQSPGVKQWIPSPFGYGAK